MTELITGHWSLDAGRWTLMDGTRAVATATAAVMVLLYPYEQASR